MIAALSPADINYEETLSTLRSAPGGTRRLPACLRPEAHSDSVVCFQVRRPGQTDPLQRRDQRRPQRQTDPGAEGRGGATEEPAVLPGAAGAAGQRW